MNTLRGRGCKQLTIRKEFYHRAFLHVLKAQEVCSLKFPELNEGLQANSIAVGLLLGLWYPISVNVPMTAIKNIEIFKRVPYEINF